MIDQDELEQEHALTVLPQQRQVPAMVVEWTEDDLQALRATVAKDCDSAQFKVFLMAAKRLGMDPFARQIVPIVQGERMTPQVTIDGMRLNADRTGKYGGQLGPEWCGKDGVWRDVWLEDGPPAAARVAVIRRDFQQPLWAVARYKSYAKGGTWTTMPDVMIAKVAESLALRKAFPQELSGVYTEDEMAQASEPEHTVREETEDERIKRRVTEAMQIRVPLAPAEQGPKPVDPWAEVRELAAQLGLNDDERGDLFKRHKRNRDKILAELRERFYAETEGREPEPAEASA